MRDAEIEALLIEFAKQDARVVQLKSRDYRNAAQIPKQASRCAAPHLVPDNDLITAD